MYIRRNYRDPFFRDKPKAPSLFRRFLLLLTVIVIGGGIAWWQQDWIISQAEVMLGPEMTPTPHPDDLIAEANQAFVIGDLTAAAALWQRALDMRPERIDYLYEYGMLLLDLDDGRGDNPDQTLDIAAQILDINPNDPRGYALRARAMVWDGNFGGAIPVAQAGLSIDPTFAPLYAALSRAYIGDGDLRQGQQAGIQAIETAPNDVRSYWAYASALAQSGARDEAISEYERVTSINPNFLPPYFELAFLYLASDRDQEAIDAYSRIIGAEPRNARALLRLCEAYRKVGQFQQARGQCEDAAAADPTYAAAQYQLGLIQYNNFEFASARDAFQACLDQQPNSLQCTYRLGLAYYYLAREEYQTVCEPERLTSQECAAPQICSQGWDLLQQSLAMAQSRSNTDGDEAIIAEGLTAIERDPACEGVTARPVATPPPPDLPSDDE